MVVTQGAAPAGELAGVQAGSQLTGSERPGTC